MSLFSGSKQIACKKDRGALISALTEPPVELGGFCYKKAKERGDLLELSAVNEYPALKNSGIPHISIDLSSLEQAHRLRLTLSLTRGVAVIAAAMALLLTAMGVGMAISGEIDFWFVPCIPWLILAGVFLLLLLPFRLSAKVLLPRLEERIGE